MWNYVDEMIVFHALSSATCVYIPAGDGIWKGDGQEICDGYDVGNYLLLFFETKSRSNVET
jgi:hypothetical protein